jgi:exodeoxyribonuclease VII large subunit
VSDIDSQTSNAQAYSVSELAFALKRTLEDAYGFVRLRGELSKVTHHASGHVYLTIKDDKAAIDGVVWKGSVRGLSVRPEQGLEVIVTGRITTFPAGSRYQIVIETRRRASAPSWRSLSVSSRSWRPRGCSPPSANNACRRCRPSLA